MGNELIIGIILVVSYLMYLRLTKLANVAEIDRLAFVAGIDQLRLANRQNEREIDELNGQMTLLQAQIDSLNQG